MKHFDFLFILLSLLLVIGFNLICMHYISATSCLELIMLSKCQNYHKNSLCICWRKSIALVFCCPNDLKQSGTENSGSIYRRTQERETMKRDDGVSEIHYCYSAPPSLFKDYWKSFWNNIQKSKRRLLSPLLISTKSNVTLMPLIGNLKDSYQRHSESHDRDLSLITHKELSDARTS